MNEIGDPGLRPGVHLMAKPVGPVCNLDCRYCFYLEKENLFPKPHRFVMSDEVLRSYIEQNILNEPSPEVLFTWQGGEPMLRGLDFYQKAVAYQKALANGKTIRNALQTNGVLLDDAWCEFLAKEGFLVGLSIDGPQDIHDAGRVDKLGRPTFARVMQGLELLKQHGIDFNALVTTTRQVAQHPLRVYQFLKAQGIAHIQFNPVVERLPAAADLAAGLSFAQPPKLHTATGKPGEVTEHSVGASAYGDFLNTIFDEWIRHDVGTIYVMNFEWALAAWLQLPATICLFAKDCGRSLIVEHDGSVYSCDHFMYPEYRLGDITSDNPLALADSPAQMAFGSAKSRTLPKYCQRCDYLFACAGECPKNRFATAPDGEPGLNYLCPSYKKYFRHITRYMNAMAKLIGQGKPAAMIMQLVARELSKQNPTK